MSALALLGFDLLHPANIAWLLAAPVLFAVALYGLSARRRLREGLVARRHQERFLPGYSENRARLRIVLAALAVLFITFALLGPVRGYTLRDVQRRGLDLVLCVDTSRSMLVQDVKPDRLTRAKREVYGLLDQLQSHGDRVALVAFSGDVRAVAPLTHDRETMKIFVSTLDTGENLVGGTNLGAAMDYALQLFDGRTGAHEAIVLITDGEDLEGQGLAVAERAAESGIRVFVVGMGTDAGGKIPLPQGGFVKDDTGQEVISSLDGTSLETIANSSGGAFLTATSSAVPLEELYEKRISKLEQRDLWAGKERVPHDRFQWPLVLALVAMLLEVGLRERRPARRRSRALRPTAQKEVAA